VRGILQKKQKKTKEKTKEEENPRQLPKKCACVFHLIIHYYNARFSIGNGKKG
jgi:hypothetical protein